MKILYKYTPLNENSEPWTDTQQKQLCSQITKLSDKQLGHVFNIVKVYEQDQIKPDEIEVDFEVLNAHTINELKNYVDSLKPWNEGRFRQLSDEINILPVEQQIHAYKMLGYQNLTDIEFDLKDMSACILDDLQNYVNSVKPWIVDQRKELEKEIRDLPEDKLGHVVNIIKIYEKNEVPSKFNIDFKKLKISTLNELQDYVDNIKPWNMDQKLKLMIQVNKLDGDQLGHIVDIIKMYEESDHDDPDFIEVDFEKLRTRTLNKIKNYLDSIQVNSNHSMDSSDLIVYNC